MLNRKNINFLNEVAFQLAMKQNIQEIELEETNNAFLAIDQEALKEKADPQIVISQSEEPAIEAPRRKSSSGKVIAGGMVASAVAVAHHTHTKKVSHKRK